MPNNENKASKFRRKLRRRDKQCVQVTCQTCHKTAIHSVDLQAKQIRCHYCMRMKTIPARTRVTRYGQSEE